jgi:hypothetical protein
MEDCRNARASQVCEPHTPCRAQTTTSTLWASVRAENFVTVFILVQLSRRGVLVASRLLAVGCASGFGSTHPSPEVGFVTKFLPATRSQSVRHSPRSPRLRRSARNLAPKPAAFVRRFWPCLETRSRFPTGGPVSQPLFYQHLADWLGDQHLAALKWGVGQNSPRHASNPTAHSPRLRVDPLFPNRSRLAHPSFAGRYFWNRLFSRQRLQSGVSLRNPLSGNGLRCGYRPHTFPP